MQAKFIWQFIRPPIITSREFESIFTRAVGTAEHLCEFSAHIGLPRTHGIANAQACLNSV